MRYWGLALMLVISIGCGGDGASGGIDGGGGGGGGADGAPPDAPAGSYTATWGPVTVPPGTEDTQCVVVPVGNSETLRVNQIHNVLGDVSHHFIVYRTNATEARTEPFDCQPFSDTLDPEQGAPLMITQKYEETLTLPEGVAFTMEPEQYVRLELHYINTGDQDKEVMATSTFIPISDSEFENEADFLFMGDADIDIPPGQEWTLGPTYFPLPSGLEGSNFFGITGHEHQYGTDVWVATTDGENGTDTPVYDVENFNWDEPETVYHDPPFQVPSGGGFRFTCTWVNTSNQNVTFGESANEEMCFFWAYYYPSQGAKVCIDYNGFQGCCPDSPLCSQL